MRLSRDKLAQVVEILGGRPRLVLMDERTGAEIELGDTEVEILAITIDYYQTINTEGGDDDDRGQRGGEPDPPGD